MVENGAKIITECFLDVLGTEVVKFYILIWSFSF